MKVRRWAVAGLGAAAAVMVVSAAAWACVSGPSMTLSTINAKAGQSVDVAGRDFRVLVPVDLRFNALNGPVLATLAKPASPDFRVAGSFTVPDGTKPGNYVIVATQSGTDGATVQMPVRALLTVVGDSGANPVVGASTATAERPAGLVTSDDSISGGSLALIGLGVAGVGMFLAGMAALFAGRRGSAPAAAQVRS